MARPSKPYRTTWGVEIHGLAKDKDGRWRIVATGFRWTDKDERRAVARFYQLTAARTMRLVPAEIDQRTDEDLFAAHAAKLEPQIERLIEIEKDEAECRGQILSQRKKEELRDMVYRARASELRSEIERHQTGPRVHESTFWTRVREEFLRDRRNVAAMTGIPALADIDPKDLPKPSIPIEAILAAYDTKNNTPRTKDRAREEWARLQKITGAKTLADLTQEVLVLYRKEMEKRLGAGTRKWLYGMIRSVISWGKSTDQPLDSGQIDAALSRCACLRVDDDLPMSRPNPISKEHLHMCLDAATGTYAMFRPIIIVALNCCLSVDEVARIEWRDLDLKKGSYYTLRNKTKRQSIPRAAMLWPETIAWLKQIQTEMAAQHRVSPYVFLSTHGDRWTTNAMINYWRDFRRNTVGIPDAPKGEPSCTFQSLRDGAYTAATYHMTGGDAHIADVLAGHSAGMRDHYVSRHPEVTQPATDAVYKHYGPFPLPTGAIAPPAPGLNQPEIFREGSMAASNR